MSSIILSDFEDEDNGNEGGGNFQDLFADENSDQEGSGSDADGEGGDRDKDNKDQDVDAKPADGDKDDKKTKVKAKPKGPVKPMMVNEDMLCGKKGLVKIQDEFKNFKFLGKGREREDLDRVLQKLEHWTHILYPRHPFSQMLERIEFLGTKKKSVKTYMKKIRMDLVSSADFRDDEAPLPEFDEISSGDEGGDKNLENVPQETANFPPSHFVDSDFDEEEIIQSASSSSYNPTLNLDKKEDKELGEEIQKELEGVNFDDEWDMEDEDGI